MGKGIILSNEEIHKEAISLSKIKTLPTSELVDSLYSLYSFKKVDISSIIDILIEVSITGKGKKQEANTRKAREIIKELVQRYPSIIDESKDHPGIKVLLNDSQPLGDKVVKHSITLSPEDITKWAKHLSTVKGLDTLNLASSLHEMHFVQRVSVDSIIEILKKFSNLGKNDQEKEDNAKRAKEIMQELATYPRIKSELDSNHKLEKELEHVGNDELSSKLITIWKEDQQNKFLDKKYKGATVLRILKVLRGDYNLEAGSIEKLLKVNELVKKMCDADSSFKSFAKEQKIYPKSQDLGGVISGLDDFTITFERKSEERQRTMVLNSNGSSQTDSLPRSTHHSLSRKSSQSSGVDVKEPGQPSQTPRNPENFTQISKRLENLW